MECGDTLHSVISILTWIWLHVCILSLLQNLDIKIDLFKIGAILFIIFKDSKYTPLVLPRNGPFKIISSLKLSY